MPVGDRASHTKVQFDIAASAMSPNNSSFYAPNLPAAEEVQNCCGSSTPIRTTLPLKPCLVVPSSSSLAHSHVASRENTVKKTTAARVDGHAQGLPQRRRRKLTFNSRTRFYLVPTIGEMSTSEYAATYRTPHDDTANQAEIVRTVDAMLQHNFRDGDAVPPPFRTEPAAAASSANTAASGTHRGDELTTRGLEHMRSAAHARDRKEAKLMVTGAIFTEQEGQWDCGRTVAEGEEDIADVSREVTARHVEEALERAAQDAAYVHVHVSISED